MYLLLLSTDNPVVADGLVSVGFLHGFLAVAFVRAKTGVLALGNISDWRICFCLVSLLCCLSFC
jgi:hypothetical protein